jgi:hypothetical protein
MIVPRLRTPIPLDSLVDALDAAHHQLRGMQLSAMSLAIAASMLELEHGTGIFNGVLCLRAVLDFNEGNHDEDAAARADPNTPVFNTVPEHEVGAGGVDYHATHVRQAYPDAVAGAVGFWQVLLDNFSDAYDAIVVGDVHAFVMALKLHHYFTATEASYEHGVASMVSQWLARIAAAGGV